MTDILFKLGLALNTRYADDDLKMPIFCWLEVNNIFLYKKDND